VAARRRREPRGLSLPPFRTRPPDMQPAAHLTALIWGDGTYAGPPEPDAYAVPPPLATTATSASPEMRQPREGRYSVSALFLRPAGLADGLAPKERRYERRL